MNPILETETIQKVNKWINSIGIANFDLEKGHVIEWMYPEVYNEEDKKFIAQNSFPDTRLFDEGCCPFHFKININSKPQFGYSYFVQKKDVRKHRGYYQKSLIIMTNLSSNSYSGLFYKLLDVISRKFLDYNFNELLRPTTILLELLFRDLASWPMQFSNITELPIIGHVMLIKRSNIKKKNNSLITNALNFGNLVEEQIVEFDHSEFNNGIVHFFENNEENLFYIWEMLLLSKNILVVGETPGVVSQTVEEIIRLVKPISFQGDSRPFFSLQGKDTNYLISSPNINNMVIGATNPHFLEILKNWSNILDLSEKKKQPKSLFENLGIKSRPIKYKLKRDDSFIDEDPEFLKQLIHQYIKVSNKDSYTLLVQFFRKLTEAFLLPLKAYFETLLPNCVKLETNNLIVEPSINTFNIEDFKKFLRIYPKLNCFNGLKFRFSFYNQFIKTSNFKTWLEKKIMVSEPKANFYLLKSYANFEFEASTISTLDKIKLVKLFKSLLISLDSNSLVSSMELYHENKSKLCHQSNILLEQLPSELRSMFDV